MFTMYDKQGRMVMKWTEAPAIEEKPATVQIAKPREAAKEAPEPLRAAA